MFVPPKPMLRESIIWRGGGGDKTRSAVSLVPGLPLAAEGGLAAERQNGRRQVNLTPTPKYQGAASGIPGSIV